MESKMWYDLLTQNTDTCVDLLDCRKQNKYSPSLVIFLYKLLSRISHPEHLITANKTTDHLPNKEQSCRSPTGRPQKNSIPESVFHFFK